MTVNLYPGDFRIGVYNEEVPTSLAPSERRLTPKQMFMLLLNGHQKFCIDDQEFTLSTEERQRPVAMMIRLEKNSTLKMLECRGRPFSKVAVSIAPRWPLREERGTGLGSDSLSQHLEHRFLEPDTQVLGSATALLAARSPQRDTLGELAYMSDGINFYRAALSACTMGAAPSVRSNRRPALDRVREHVARHLGDPQLNALSLSRACALSPRTLQRLCQEHFGQGPADFIRSRRMALALSALRDQSASVSQAAFIAGYSSPSNFSTAFKREFGFSPRLVLRSCPGPC
ncbi:helix-turn-helix transcriptional regulator [Pseudomonas sp. ABC1]|uniref:helix-turn-helix transcriptional regulator n=1 Tax=Pseudomonas sp. ABC1 TaxID=2748080 RepID=UPI0015C3DC5B|nr:AraC family transcriptional regulator [Pseudomonas sp. ABC1]QLF94825.1 helix-turn-helix transcriptional regulator [Pseudomonas sp. ABC1]